MEFYVYQADVWCEQCGQAIREDLKYKRLAPDDPDDEYTYDSDEFPKGPYSAEQEESDSPHHCAAGEDCMRSEVLPSGRKIGAFIPFALTSDGVEYIKEALRKDPQSEVVRFWVEEYSLLGYDFDEEIEE